MTTSSIAINSTFTLQITEHQELFNTNRKIDPKWCLTDDERTVVCHDGRDESAVAHKQRELYLHYGLNVALFQNEEEYKLVVRDAISKAIKEMKALGVDGVDAIRTNVNTQSEAFSRHIVKHANKSWPDAHR
jgi:hypothetical protein